MRRLTIALIGESLTLNELQAELLSHGHQLRYLADQSLVDTCRLDGVSLLIDDGTLELPVSCDAAPVERLTLGVSISPDATQGLPRLELLCWQGDHLKGRLIARSGLATQASGNGRMLRDAAVASLVDIAALWVSGLSRDAGHLLAAPTLDPPQGQDLSGLHAVDRLLFEHRFNQTCQPHLLVLAQQPLIERLEESLQHHAERCALVFSARRISYLELHAHGSAIQQALLPMLAEHQGGGPVVVGICLPKSPALFAGILAILGCAAVYLPLDPDQPLQRQRYILENAGARLLLHDGLHPLADDGFPALDISRIEAPAQAQPLMRERPGADAACMALYTSGTTGQPKGVLLSQRNLSHFTAWYAEYVQLCPQSRVLQFSTLSFDSSLIDIFPAWLSGAELVVADADQRRDPTQLQALIRQGITHAFIPPALLSILALDKPLGLKHLMTGGDVCEPPVIRHLANSCRLHNLYGPTEATVLISAAQLQVDSSNRYIGRPIANSQVWILDEHRQPVADDTQGELFIAGPGVCLGYVNNPQLNAERYVPLRLPDGQVLRAYRTGDTGKWTSQGIELCGRRDNQVKIRGMRVEPEEVEHCLRASGLYRQIAVVVDEHRRILAFVAQPDDIRAGSALQALRAHVEGQLPDYMRPVAYTSIPNMPFSRNGKVDRNALLALPVKRLDQQPVRMPETERQRQLQALWAQLLDLPPQDISTDESFFTLGGHSILLSQMLLQIRERFGRGIAINRFIEAPTLLTLASLIDGDGTAGTTVSAQALRDASRELVMPVLPGSELGDVDKVIVTGANSFLGVHIVQALLAQEVTEIACLVREGDGRSARQRFLDALRDNRLETLDLSRVTVYPADVTQPRLGLSLPVYERLDREFGALVHNAANVNHVQDYETLVRDNVAPIHECLRLCEGRRKKIFNFISTLSASSAIDGQGNVLEQPAAASPPIYIKNGYNLTKWVAERVLQRAIEQGVWVNIYRPGNIAFNSQTGVCQPHKNRLLLMLKGSLQLGQVPAFTMNFDLMPVDFLARFIGFHASRYQPGAAVFNLHNPQPLSWSRYVEGFREAGREFETVSVARWQTRLGEVDSRNALFGVLGFYLNGLEEDIGDVSMIEYRNAQAGVLRMGERYPRKSRALLRKGCDYLKEINFI
jgi:amino acid adenylation domain-containing protein/thioester reductase-like protein